ncbi:hypothetical protein TSOC_005858 [Tetrabaena socialis]|uniref:phytol kinase n=1 Tax=Tetrabaena socialis TaxID=47790 RepID=A0A2J8A5A4_9CHLO|nr:hypothetical protein TSOC_005858 [Tetrabaena socialis]|eukprot:PNH07701.1 hypothetical protein TSOC_005858 [Tetrabaena socialis]
MSGPDVSMGPAALDRSVSAILRVVAAVVRWSPLTPPSSNVVSGGSSAGGSGSGGCGSGGGSGGGSGDGCGGARGSALAYQKVAEAAGSLLRVLLDSSPAALGFLGKLLRMHTFQCLAQRFAEAATSAATLTEQQTSHAAGLAILLDSLLRAAFSSQNGRNPSLWRDLAVALRDSSVLEHAGRLLLLLLLRTPRGGATGAAEHLLNLSCAFLRMYQILGMQHSRMPVNGQPFCSELHGVLSSCCARHAAMVYSVAALCMADGGRSYGLAEDVRRAARANTSQLVEAGPDLGLLQLQPFSFLAGGVVALSPPVGARAAVLLLLRSCRLAVASGDVWAAREQQQLHQVPAGAPAATGGGRVQVVVARDDIASSIYCAWDRAWRLLDVRLVEHPPGWAVDAGVECWRLLAAALRPNALRLVTPDGLRLWGEGLLHRWLPVLPPGEPLPPAPPPAIAAVLAGGLLPCLERLLRRTGEEPDGLESAVVEALLNQENTWHRWAPLLKYGELGQAAALVATLAKLLRRADLRLQLMFNGMGADRSIILCTGLLSEALASTDGLLQADGQQLTRVLSYAVCEWLPAISDLALQVLQAVADRSLPYDEKLWELLGGKTLFQWQQLLTGLCCGVAAADGSTEAPGSAGDSSTAVNGAGGWRLLLLEEMRVVPLLCAALRLAKRAPLHICVSVVESCCVVAAAFPDEVLRAASSSAWSPELVRSMVAKLRLQLLPAHAAGMEALAALLDAGRAAGSSGRSGGVKEAHERLVAEVAKIRRQVPEEALLAQAALVPPEVARTLLRTCSHRGCISLAGDSEADARMRWCRFCSTACYCCGECQLAHWRDGGHKDACSGGAKARPAVAASLHAALEVDKGQVLCGGADPRSVKGAGNRLCLKRRMVVHDGAGGDPLWWLEAGPVGELALLEGYLPTMLSRQEVEAMVEQSTSSPGESPLGSPAGKRALHPGSTGQGSLPYYRAYPPPPPMSALRRLPVVVERLLPIAPARPLTEEGGEELVELLVKIRVFLQQPKENEWWKTAAIGAVLADAAANSAILRVVAAVVRWSPLTPPNSNVVSGSGGSGGGGSGGGSGDGGGGALGSALAYQKVAEAAGLLLPMLLDSSPAALGFLGKLLRMHTFQCLAQRFAEAATSAATLTEQQTSHAACLAVLLDGLLSEAFMPSNSRNPSLWHDLAVALRDSSVLEHAGRLLLLLLLRAPAGDATGAVKPLLLMSRAFLRTYHVLGMQHSRMPVNGQLFCSELYGVLSSCCARHAAMVYSVAALRVADGGRSYGLPEDVRQAASDGVTRIVEAGQDLGLLQLQPFSFLGGGVVALSPPVGARAAVLLLLRSCRLAVASGDVWAAREQEQLHQLPAGAPAATGGGRVQVVVARDDIASLTYCAWDRAWRLLILRLVEDAPGWAVDAGVECWRLLAAALRPNALRLVTPDGLQIWGEGLLHRWLPVLPPGELLPPASPPIIAAVLAGGLLPCLERLLRRMGEEPDGPESAVVGPLLRQGYTWHRWAPLLKYGELGQAAALVATLGKLLRRADLRVQLLFVGVGADRLIVHLCTGLLMEAVSSTDGLLQADGQQLMRLLFYAVCEWLPAISGLALEVLQAVADRSVPYDGKLWDLLGGNILFHWQQLLTGICWRNVAAADGASTEVVASASGPSAAVGGAGGWRLLLLEEMRVVPLLSAALHLAGHAPHHICVSVVESCCVVAAAFPDEVLRAASSSAWSPELVRSMVPHLWQRLILAHAAVMEALAALLDEGRAVGSSGRSGGVKEAHGRLVTAVAKFRRNIPTGALLAQAALVPPEVARTLLRTCSHRGCTSLAGDSETDARMRWCRFCGAACYCCGECQLAH